MAPFKKRLSSEDKAEKKITESNVSKTADTEEDYERCAYCGRLTEIKTSTPVSLRVNYLSGVGQLCSECFGKLSK